MKSNRRSRTARHVPNVWNPLLVSLVSVGTFVPSPALGQTVFMKSPGGPDAATTLSMDAGTCEPLEIWLDTEDWPFHSWVAGTQILLHWSAVPQGRPVGTVMYEDNNPGAGDGDSFEIDKTRSDWLFADSIIHVLSPVLYGEAPTSPSGPWFGTSFVPPSVGGVQLSLNTSYYLAEFRICASSGASGTFEFRFRDPDDPAPTSALFNPGGGNAAPNLVYRPLSIAVSGESVWPGEACCMPEETCAFALAPGSCTFWGGVGLGGGTTCSPNPCAGAGVCCNLVACTQHSTPSGCSEGTWFPGVETCTPGFCTSGAVTIGPAGGAVSSPDESASVWFPPGCLSTDTAISMEWGDWPMRIFDVLASGGDARVLASYTFEPSGLDFCDTAELCIKVDLARALLTADDCDTLELKFREGTCSSSPSTDCRSDGECGASGPCDFTFETLTLSRPPNCSDPANATFCAYIGHFSDYGLVGPDSGSVPTVSEWGLIALTLLLLVGAKVFSRRHEGAAA